MKTSILSILLLTSILCELSSSQATVKVAISNEQITIAKDTFLPYIVPMLETAHYSDSLKKIGLWEFKVSDTTVSIEPIDPYTQAFIELVPNSNYLNVSVFHLTLNQSQHYKYKDIEFTVEANITDVDFYVVMQLNTLDGHPNITCRDVNVTADKNKIDVHVVGMVGVIDDILDGVLDIAREEFYSNSMHYLEKGFVQDLDNLTNIFVNTLPTSVLIGEDFRIKYYLPKDPYIIENYLTVMLAGEIIYKGQPISVPTEQSYIPDYYAEDTTGIQIFLSQDLIENVAEVGFNAGLFQVKDVKFFKGYADISCNISDVPALDFTTGVITFSGSASCTGTALKSFISYTFTTSVSGRIHQSIADSKLVFQTASASFPDIKGVISIFGFDLISIEWFKLPFDYMLNGLEDILNKVLVDYPLALPKLTVVQYPNLSENVEEGYLRVLASVSANQTALNDIMEEMGHPTQ